MKELAKTNLPPAKCHCINVRRASRAITQLYDKFLEPSGLKITQYSLLMNVLRTGPISISNLSKVIRLDRTTLARNLKHLAEEDLIVIIPGKDSRTRQVSITTKGIDTLDQAKPLWEKAQEYVNELFGQDSLTNLIDLLNKLENLK